MQLDPGRMIAHYRIDRKLGEGGMGIVYLAEDTRLGRRIALKVLPEGMSADAGRRARFEREARAIATLNHPNIVTLHSVEEADGISFITLEYVDGQRLTDRLTRDGLELPKLLDWSVGIADALVAAHRQGVVHRDLKPDNVMITSDGRVKVLDFGLAKLRESALDSPTTMVKTTSITEEGKILGTVSYMSPEQAEGKPLDHRSDIFSFGVLLYEMATGRRPFQGDTAISTISSILKDTPAPPQQLNAALPEHLVRLVRRCLAKEPDRRFQSTDDLRNELRDLKEERDSGELSIERTAARGASVAKERPAAPPERSSRPRPMALVAGLAVIAAAAGWLALRGRGTARPETASGPITMSRATSDGRVSEAAISPDGRYVAYVRREGKVRSIRLRQLATGDEVQVVAPGEGRLTSPVFSPDGNYLNYIAFDPGQMESSGSAYRVSSLGGTPRRLLEGVHAVDASLDGKHLAILGGTFTNFSLKVTGPDGENPRELTTRKGQDHFDSGPHWSSDGRAVAIVSHRFGEPQQIALIDSESGTERLLPLPALHSMENLTWIPGADALLVSGSELPVNRRPPSQIWEATTSGELRPLTRDLNSYGSLSVTADGATVAVVQEERRTGILVADVKDGVPGPFREVLPVSTSLAGVSGIAWLSEDEVVHSMLQGDVEQIFATSVTTRSSRALTTGPPHQAPAVSADRRTLTVVRNDGDRGALWRLDPATGREQKVTDGTFDDAAVLNDDGSVLLYTASGESLELRRVATAGGPSVKVTNDPAYCFGILSGGADALCISLPATGPPEWSLIAVAGGPPRPIPGLPPATQLAGLSADNRSVVYLSSREGADELWQIPAQGGEPRRQARFEGIEVDAFAWSPSGQRLAVVRQTRSGDVVLLKRGGR